MSKLRKKIFYIVLGILTVSLLSFLLVFNVQNYQDQKDIIKRSMNFNGKSPRALPIDSMINKNIRFMDANVITICLDSNDNIVEIIITTL